MFARHVIVRKTQVALLSAPNPENATTRRQRELASQRGTCHDNEPRALGRRASLEEIVDQPAGKRCSPFPSRDWRSSGNLALETQCDTREIDDFSDSDGLGNVGEQATLAKPGAVGATEILDVVAAIVTKKPSMLAGNGREWQLDSGVVVTADNDLATLEGNLDHMLDPRRTKARLRTRLRRLRAYGEAQPHRSPLVRSAGSRFDSRYDSRRACRSRTLADTGRSDWRGGRHGRRKRAWIDAMLLERR